MKLVESVLRVILSMHMPGAELVRFMPGSRTVLLRFWDRDGRLAGEGVSPSLAVLALETRRHA